MPCSCRMGGRMPEDFPRHSPTSPISTTDSEIPDSFCCGKAPSAIGAPPAETSRSVIWSSDTSSNHERELAYETDTHNQTHGGHDSKPVEHRAANARAGPSLC